MLDTCNTSQRTKVGVALFRLGSRVDLLRLQAQVKRLSREWMGVSWKAGSCILCNAEDQNRANMHVSAPWKRSMALVKVWGQWCAGVHEGTSYDSKHFKTVYHQERVREHLIAHRE